MFVQVLANAVVAASVYALVALSFALIYLPVRFFHFAHGATLVWGAYLCYTGHVILKLPFWIAAPLAVLASALLGVVMELGVYRPARRRGASPTILLLTSLGLYVVLQNLISAFFGDGTQSMRSGPFVDSLRFLGARITGPQLLIVGFAIGVFPLVWLGLKFTAFGRAMRAIACDSELAFVSGVNRDQVILGAFAFGSALAALTGILISLDVDMTPTMGLHLLMLGVVAVIAGGIDSVPGVALGALLLGLAQHFGVWKLGAEWQETITFIVLIAFLLCRPQGVFGKPLRKAEL
jgi:branched-chain amino acid transport system permease protein